MVRAFKEEAECSAQYLILKEQFSIYWYCRYVFQVLLLAIKGQSYPCKTDEYSIKNREWPFGQRDLVIHNLLCVFFKFTCVFPCFDLPAVLLNNYLSHVWCRWPIIAECRVHRIVLIGKPQYWPDRSLLTVNGKLNFLTGCSGLQHFPSLLLFAIPYWLSHITFNSFNVQLFAKLNILITVTWLKIMIVLANSDCCGKYYILSDYCTFRLIRKCIGVNVCKANTYCLLLNNMWLLRPI